MVLECESGLDLGKQGQVLVTRDQDEEKKKRADQTREGLLFMAAHLRARTTRKSHTHPEPWIHLRV